MTHLAQNPEILEPLRKEIVDTLQQHGWKKAALYNMKLLESVNRESQRLKPVTNGKQSIIIFILVPARSLTVLCINSLNAPDGS